LIPLFSPFSPFPLFQFLNSHHENLGEPVATAGAPASGGAWAMDCQWQRRPLRMLRGESAVNAGSVEHAEVKRPVPGMARHPRTHHKGGGHARDTVSTDRRGSVDRPDLDHSAVNDGEYIGAHPAGVRPSQTT
jgi:hypothetical protein